MFDAHHLPNPIPNEKIVYFLRRHTITILPLLIGFAVLLIAPFAAYAYIAAFQPQLFDEQIIMTLLVLGGSTFFLFAWLFLFQNFVDYYLDIWIVTDRRILSIEQVGLFSRTVSELRLYRIQDVTATVNGAIHTIFDYGDVEIQTAGEKVRFLFEEVPFPNKVAKTILELSEVDRREHLDEAVEDFAMADKKNAQQKG